MSDQAARVSRIEKTERPDVIVCLVFASALLLGGLTADRAVALQAAEDPALAPLMGEAEPTPAPDGALAEESEAGAVSSPPASEESSAPTPLLAGEEIGGDLTAVETGAAPRKGSVAERGKKRVRKRDTAVSGSQLAELGFFQDFEELSLDALLDPDVLEITTTLGSLREQALEAAPGAVSVLTASDIANLGVRSLDQLINMLPGFDVMTDSLGRARLIARGLPTGGMAGSSESVIVMINGYRLNEAIDGGATALNLAIPTNHIKKLEVLRGPATLLYGAGALGAVINVVTDDPGEYAGIRVGSSMGSDWTQQQSLQLNNSLGGIDVAASLHFSGSSGAQVLVPADAQSAWDQRQASSGWKPISLAPRRTEDDYSMLDTLYRIAYRNVTLDWRAHQQQTGGYIGYANSFGKDDRLFGKQMSFDLTYNRESERWGKLRGHLSLTLSAQSDLFEIIPPGFEGVDLEGRPFRVSSSVYLKTKINTRRYVADGLIVRDIAADHHVTAGVALEREATQDLEASGNLSFASLTPMSDLAASDLAPLPQIFPSASRNMLSLFVHDAWNPTYRLALTGGLRVDFMSDYDPFVSPSLAAVLTLPRDVTLKLLYARAFRRPTFTERDFNLPGFDGNDMLRLVTAQSLESVLVIRRHNLRASAAAFASFVRDPIPSVRPANVYTTTPLTNAPGYDIYGLEVEGRMSVGLNTFFTNYTYQRPREIKTARRVADLPSQLVTLGATLSLGDRYSISPLLRARSERPRALDDPRRRVPAFGWFDLTFRAMRLYETLEVAATITNLFDQPLCDPSPIGGVPGDYPLPGRRVFFQATYQF